MDKKKEFVEGPLCKILQSIDRRVVRCEFSQEVIGEKTTMVYSDGSVVAVNITGDSLSQTVIDVIKKSWAY